MLDWVPGKLGLVALLV